MRAHPVLLQKKYARVVSLFAQRTEMDLSEALDVFYHSVTYQILRSGETGLHCMSDEYLADELLLEWKETQRECDYADQKVGE